MTDTSQSDESSVRITVTVSALDDASHVLDVLGDLDVVLEPSSAPPRPLPGEFVLELGLGSMTAKQWEALELAYEEGYYDRPRRVDLADLADNLAISKSALSQRLRGAEGVLVEAVFDAVAAWPGPEDSD